MCLALGLTLLLAWFTATTALAGAAPPRQAGPDGGQIFQAKCTGCHTIGQGKLVGPDLLGVSTRRDPQWIKRFITDPNQMFAANDPTALQLLKDNNNIKMPALGLPAAEVDALVAYLAAATPGAAAGTGAPGTGTAVAVGDPLAGSQLFLGNLGLGSGGPPCIACHTVAGTGALGGGALGPDLTHVAQRYGQPGLAAALQNIAFPTMLGPFTNRPLTAVEQADLVAFFVQVDQQQTVVPAAIPGAITANTWIFLAIGLAGALVLFGILLAFWPGQAQTVSARLRAQARSARTGWAEQSRQRRHS